MKLKKIFSGPPMAILFGLALGAALIILASTGNRADDGGASSEEKIALAQCLTEKGTTFYGAFWCPHCANQKAAFGKDAFEHVEYVECSNPDRSMTAACQNAGIESYPTWEFADGTRVTGEQSLLALAQGSDCAYLDYTPEIGPAAPEMSEGEAAPSGESSEEATEEQDE